MTNRKYHTGSKYCKTKKLKPDKFNKHPIAFDCCNCQYCEECIEGRALVGATKDFNRIFGELTK